MEKSMRALTALSEVARKTDVYVAMSGSVVMGRSFYVFGLRPRVNFTDWPIKDWNSVDITHEDVSGIIDMCETICKRIRILKEDWDSTLRTLGSMAGDECSHLGNKIKRLDPDGRTMQDYYLSIVAYEISSAFPDPRFVQ